MAAPTTRREKSILTGVYNKDEDTEAIVKWFHEGLYETILESSCISKQILLTNHKDQLLNSLESLILCNVEYLLHNKEQQISDIEVLILAISCLHLFIQNNFLGPPTSTSPLEYCHEHFLKQSLEIEKEAFSGLSIDGETVYPRTRHIIFLYIARIILLECRAQFTHVQTWDWWLARCLLIQQSLLSERSPTLKATVLDIFEELSKKEPLMTDDSNKDIELLFHIEAGHAHHTYLEYRKAAEHFASGKKISALEVSLTGAMGRRTRYQEDAKAQLVLRVERKEVNDWNETLSTNICDLPKNLPLDDDTVLNDIKFIDEDAVESPKLSPIELALVLGLMESYRRSCAQDRLTDEEVLTYLAFILSQTNNWNISLMALNLRSRLERDSRRRVERSMMQLEELVKISTTPNTKPDIWHRIPLFYACQVPAIWKIQGELASLLLSLGCLGDALSVFEKLELWEDVIACYQKMGKSDRAETLIKERLAIEETPSLLCYLGDITRDIQHYQRAWELSNHKSARAKRCMGYIYFQEEKYEQAIESFAVSLKINSLQIPVWFTYGCASMACQKFEEGAKAFKRCVNLDFDNFEAWSNLATCYVRLKEKKKAYATLQDALKCNYDNWRLWENNLIIGTDCGEFEDVIRSYHRLLDLREKWVDKEVLNILTRAVLEKIPDADGRSAERLDSKLSELFGRITSKVTSEGEIWANYAKLSSNKIQGKEPDLEKALQFLQKSYRCYTQKVDWEKDVVICKKVGDEAVNLAQIHLQCASGKSQTESLKLLSAAKILLNGAVVKIQKQHTDPVTHELSSEVTETCQKIKDKLNEIVAQIDEVRNES
ncbi:tetratricopeptide repeat protein 27 [Biomphalaria glabrata]|uniref:Tetratricopeptide repeat protein 27-like n=1 Tax=Biomphalaria glabrata TaxID=6526 RepID=A0A9W3A0D6_BIOGL|nr:tetratricopeptide repeat protein 27-like [Biomphalaria glabrata]KAI8746921.1 tetratricopeptide repeat protein 27-like [Biomphalaria glabrata]KAI8788615.1 tetratricopeptide repeat protein 27 [Biomphalaria glabrata]